MTVYVDELFTMTPRTAAARRYGNRWCHLTADSVEELHAFAQSKLRMPRAWFQDHPTLPHYDLTPSKRVLAVQCGARKISMHERLAAARQAASDRAASPSNDTSIYQQSTLFD
jgi:hypothetical protein